jgi:hypothetical protein
LTGSPRPLAGLLGGSCQIVHRSRCCPVVAWTNHGARRSAVRTTFDRLRLASARASIHSLGGICGVGMSQHTKRERT